MVKIGMIIGDRYEVQEKIGTGGMSDVYRAKDHKLNRFVAVKVLKQEFSENANFVSKFRVEAQAAAGLAHPNIVNVYDVGEENGIYYIVMELVEGITLKKYIERKARLSVKEAVSISKEGKVKVTDFGIAKAATSNTITSNVMGSVHYTSPEQARGGYSDEKSDIYSLGVTMFEMLTGRVPFNGETTVAIAIKHIQEEMPSPREYVSEIPVSVEQIVFKCCQKSPDRRYQSMGQLIADLKRSLMTPDEDFVKMVDPNEEGSTKMMDSSDREKIKRQARNRDSMEEAMHLRKEADMKKIVRRKREIPYELEEDEDEEEEEDDIDETEYEDEEDEDEDEDYDPKMERITTVLAVVAAILIGCIVLFLVGKALGLFDGSLFGETTQEQEQEEEKEQVEMIEAVGKDVDEVKVALLNIGLTPEIEYEESIEFAQGIVMKSSVAKGTMVEEGSNVVLTVSAGSEGVKVEDTVGMSEAEATATLGKSGFVVNKTESHDPYIKAGNVITQSPAAGSKAPKGTTVTLTISLGPEISKVQVPDLMAKGEEEAMALLVESGLQLGAVGEVNHEDPALTGLVCYQSYSVGTYVDAGTVVDINISLGPAQATYRFMEAIAGPTPEEDPAYRAGTMVTVTLMADDGTQLLSTQTASFPIEQQNITGIKSPTGYILFQYMNVTEGSSVTNEDGSVSTIEGTSESKEIRRPIQFMEE